MNVTYSEELQEALSSWSQSSISIDWKAPAALGRSLQSGLPYNFAKYDVRSSFLINNWQNMIMLLIILAIYLIVRGVQWIAKSQHSWLRIIRVLVQNFLLAQLYRFYGEFVLYSILDWRSAKDNGSRISNLNLAISCAMAVVIMTHLVLHFKLLRNYQKIRVTQSKEQLEAFRKKHERSQFLFRDFKDDSLSKQLFLFYLIIRDLLFSLILTTLFEFPIVQIWILLIMTVSMFVYLLMKRPFKESIDFAQQIINELVTFIVVGSVLTQAIMGDNGSKTARIGLGKLIIIVNIIFNYVTLLFMVCKLLLIVKAGYKAWKADKEKETASRKVHRISDSTMPSQMSMIHDSTFRSMISHIPKRPSLQQAGDSFFSGFHEDLGHHEINKNPKAPRNITIRNTTNHANISMDELNFQSISIETERPLVFASQARLKYIKPVQKRPLKGPSQFAGQVPRFNQPIQSITPPETEREVAPRTS